MLLYSTTQQNTHYTGFTLVEVLVAISLLLLALVGPMTFIARSSQSTELNNQQVPAVFLAQEGVELVQKVRDDELRAWFSPSASPPAWSNMRSYLSACFSSSGCGLSISSVDTVNVRSCATIENCRLYYNEADTTRSKYVYDSSAGDVTPYTRVIYLNEVVAGREVEVRSEVTWRSGTLRDGQRVEVETAIFNIYDTD